MGSFYVTVQAQLEATFRVTDAADESAAQHLAELRFARMARAIRKRHAVVEKLDGATTTGVSVYPPGFHPGDLVP